MRTTFIAVPSAALMRPRTPGVILLAHDFKMLLSGVIRFTKKLYGH